MRISRGGMPRSAARNMGGTTLTPVRVGVRCVSVEMKAPVAVARGIPRWARCGGAMTTGVRISRDGRPRHTGGSGIRGASGIRGGGIRLIARRNMAEYARRPPWINYSGIWNMVSRFATVCHGLPRFATVLLLPWPVANTILIFIRSAVSCHCTVYCEMQEEERGPSKTSLTYLVQLYRYRVRTHHYHTTYLQLATVPYITVSIYQRCTIPQMSKIPERPDERCIRSDQSRVTSRAQPVCSPRRFTT